VRAKKGLQLLKVLIFIFYDQLLVEIEQLLCSVCAWMTMTIELDILHSGSP